MALVTSSASNAKSSTVLGAIIPDSKLAREITELVRDTEPPLLFHHSSRVYYWGALTGKRRGLRFDPEFLYAGAMFHDMGLTPKHASAHERFEVDSANAARDFLRSHGIADREIETVWTAIALHTTPGVPEHMEPEIALVTAGVETDVLGIGYADLDPADISAVTAAHPRPDFKRQILAAFANVFKDRPDTTFGTVNADVLEHFVPGFHRTDFVEVIESNAWPE